MRGGVNRGEARILTFKPVCNSEMTCRFSTGSAQGSRGRTTTAPLPADPADEMRALIYCPACGFAGRPGADVGVCDAVCCCATVCADVRVRGAWAGSGRWPGRGSASFRKRFRNGIVEWGFGCGAGASGLDRGLAGGVGGGDGLMGAWLGGRAARGLDGCVAEWLGGWMAGARIRIDRACHQWSGPRLRPAEVM